MFGPKCQSCGMPISKDADKGTNADKSLSKEYCIYCYQDGKFTNPNATADDIIKTTREKMKEMHMPDFMTNMFVKGIPKLKRWNKS